MAREGTTYRHLLGRVVTPALGLATPVTRMRHAWARERLVIRLKVLAARSGASIHVRVGRDVRIDQQPRLEIYPRTANALVIGDDVVIGDGIRLSFRGGSMSVGAGTELRRLSAYQLTGTLTVGEGVVLSNGVTVHCAESIDIGGLTIIGEYTTITDSRHERTPPDVPIHHTSVASPVRIGRNIWVGAHAVITPGVTVGDQAFVGAAAVVTKDVAPGWLVAGVPARPIRELTER
ncbi:MAG TPA: DapH/DapD/GlmU-related protein [Mycobacteriales bacterium]|nr:DapH/DapD/GlmU-related protein [Mycobacteriales bacterium]